MQAENRFDLTGCTFGRLTALRCIEGARSRGVWECRCACGNVKLVSYHSLTQGRSTSCGCGRARVQDLAGQRFGKLLAIEATGERKNRCMVWRCRCDCGNEALVPSNSLRSGNTCSCGCGQDSARRAGGHDLTGRCFGRLTAIAPLEKRSGGSVVWQCRCDCGKESRHSAKALLSGRALSCGCLKLENDALQKSLHYIDGTCVEFVENMGRLRSNNTSGYPGLKLVRGRWEVRITFKKKSYYLGAYTDKDEAIRVRKRAEQRVFGEFLDWYYAEFPDRATKKHRLEQQTPEINEPV